MITAVLSHYHLDHIIGIIYLLNICRDKELVIYGPGEAVYGDSCAVILERLIQPPYFSRRLKDFSHKVSILDYNEGTVQVTPNYVIEFIKQNHSQPSFGMLVNNCLYYATDTSVVRDTFEKAKNAKLLLHECWDIEGGSDKHSSLKSFLDMNQEYKLQEVKLIHLNPNWTSSDYKQATDLLQDSNISFANDGEEYEIEDLLSQLG